MKGAPAMPAAPGGIPPLATSHLFVTIKDFEALGEVYGPAFVHGVDEPGLQGRAADRDEAVRLYSQLAAGQLAFAFQAIVACADPTRELYQEALLRMRAPDREVCSAGPAIAALERLNLVRYLDHCVVNTVLALLAATPALHLGCNISAQSTVEDAWWTGIFERLAAAPELAGRLVIEITESARVPDAAAGLAFVRRLQAFGCRVAIDDFGSGFLPLDFVVRARPDIIKISGDYLRRGREHDTDRAVFRSLLQLGASIATDVVAEGVETHADFQSIGNGRNAWAQGWFVGRPTLLPAWHANDHCVLAAADAAAVSSMARRARRDE